MCPHASSCTLFPQFTTAPALKLWQIRYCEGDEPERCARYKLASEGARVPANLLPSGALLRLRTRPST